MGVGTREAESWTESEQVCTRRAAASHEFVLTKVRISASRVGEKPRRAWLGAGTAFAFSHVSAGTGRIRGERASLLEGWADGST